METVIIVGGGLAGLICANCLAEKNISVTLIEKKAYPFHRVCGEYISNETLPFLKSNHLFPEELTLPKINRFQLTSVNGRDAHLPLDLGGFGISRYTFDHFLYQKALKRGVNFILNTEAANIQFADDQFQVKANSNIYSSKLVIGSFGKRSRMDISLDRNFIRKRSPYAGVKYHIRTDHPADLISLHNFKDGYCGLSQIEEGKYTLCYLTHRTNLKKFGSIKEMEEKVLYKNPFLKSVFQNSEFLFERPEVINEISFATKSPIENHVLMAGDAAGMITPLCGNGMAMAIHSAKILSELVVDFVNGKLTRSKLETSYSTSWNSHFARRLWAGRQIQRLFGNEWSSNLAVNLMRKSKPVAEFIISQTHGAPF
ncbi:MAG TPA: NAD(P)/FAD-dependent oxidoreductase [Cyclobacteriaceae bacterium]|nr:NAD(P)/FAD-dependent oxidoreductase [Cyclobacteriaceae bacterium]